MAEQKAASAAVVSLLDAYLEEQAVRTHAQLGDVAGVAVTLAVDRAPLTLGSSTELARDVDQIQYTIGHGPCLTALREGVELYVADLAADPRWAPYGVRAAERGARSCISVPVRVEDLPAAVLKVYSGEVGGLSERQRHLARRAAAELTGGIRLACGLVAYAEELDDRTAAMDRRRNIDLAVGILMERAQLDATAAFGLLRSYSQSANVKLRDAADRLLVAVAGVADENGAPFLPSAARRAGRRA